MSMTGGRARRWAWRAGIGLLGIGLLAVVAPQVWVANAARGRVHTGSDQPSAPVALVLGAGLSADGTPSPFLAGRLDRAKELYDNGKVQVIVVSGDNRFANYDEPTAMYRYLVEAGVPAKHVVRDFAGRATYDSCVRAKEVFGVERLVVVSQTYHLPRAIALCRAAGVEAVGYGDETAKDISQSTYDFGARRELPANIKAAWHAVTRPDPVLGPRETSVDEALAD